MNTQTLCINNKFDSVIKNIKISNGVLFIDNEIIDDWKSQEESNFSINFKNYLRLYMSGKEYDRYADNILNSTNDIQPPFEIKLKIVLAWYHFKFNDLAEMLNKRISNVSDGHYWAQQSRDLINVINDIKDLKDVGINITKEYEKYIANINFLKQSGGSVIPKNFQKLEIIKYKVIFKCHNCCIAEDQTIKTIESISLSSNTYQSYSKDEKICYINNSLEYLLKTESYYKQLNEKHFFNLITNEQCKTYRTITQIFRHATKECMVQRNTLTDSDKKFLIDYGETIINRILKEKQ